MPEDRLTRTRATLPAGYQFQTNRTRDDETARAWRDFYETGGFDHGPICSCQVCRGSGVTTEVSGGPFLHLTICACDACLAFITGGAKA